MPIYYYNKALNLNKIIQNVQFEAQFLQFWVVVFGRL